MQSRYAEPEADGKDPEDRREFADRLRILEREDGGRSEALRGEHREEGIIDSIKAFFGFGGFPEYSEIAKDATVKSACDAAWAETRSTTVDGARREQGFWIRWNAETKAFSVTGHGAGTVVGNDKGAVVTLPPKPADAEPEYTVASFHTHTPTFFRDVGRPTGPSGADLKADKADNVAGLVYDYSIANAPAHHPIDSAAQLYSTGQRRTGQPKKPAKAADTPATTPAPVTV
jgi:hypothetical protein